MSRKAAIVSAAKGMEIAQVFSVMRHFLFAFVLLVSVQTFASFYKCIEEGTGRIFLVDDNSLKLYEDQDRVDKFNLIGSAAITDTHRGIKVIHWHTEISPKNTDVFQFLVRDVRPRMAKLRRLQLVKYPETELFETDCVMVSAKP